MPWIRPTSYKDPGDAWENEANAIDGDEATYAICRGLPNGEYTPVLCFYFPYKSSLRWKFKYGLDSDPQWSNWHVGDLTGNPADAICVWVYNNQNRIIDAYVFECYLEVECYGPLAPICGIFHKIGDFFTDLADKIDNIMFVGDALAAPFVNLAETFHDLGNTCCQVSAALQEILDAVEGGLSWAAIEALLRANFPTLFVIVDDPVGWFLVQLTLAFDLEPWHTQSLEFLAKWILEEYFPTLYQIWLDPDTWLRARVEAIIGELAESVQAFLDNAWAWLLDQYEDAFKSIQARLYNLAERTLRFFWEGEW